MMFFLPPFRRSPCVFFDLLLSFLYSSCHCFFFKACGFIQEAEYSAWVCLVWLRPVYMFFVLVAFIYSIFFSHCNFTFIYLFPPPPLPLLLVLVLVLPPPPSPSPFIHPAKLTNQGVTANESCSWPGFLSVLQEIRVLD